MNHMFFGNTNVSVFFFCSVASKTKFFEDASRQVVRYVKAFFLGSVLQLDSRVDKSDWMTIIYNSSKKLFFYLSQ